MQKMIILFLLMMMICPSSAEPVTVNNVSTMAELLTAVDNTSIIEISDGYYTVYEPINITTTVFTLTENTRIDTFAFIEFSNLIAYDHTLKGFESGRKRRTDNRYIESGYIIVRENLTMDDMYVRGLGSEYRAARYNNGITVYGNSNVTDSIFEYVKRFAVVSETETVLVYYKDTSYWKTQFTKTTNTFNDNTFKRADVVVYNSVNVSLTDCEFTNSRISAHNYDNRNNPDGVHTESCTFTDTNDRQAGDGHYSGIHGYWANIFISDSTLNDCDIRAGDRPVIVNNCTLTDGDIVLCSARKSTITDSTLRNGSILISGGAEEIQIHDNNISGDFYGIQIGTHAKYGITSITQLNVYDNKINNTTRGIAILNAYATSHSATIHDNTVQDSAVSLYTHGYSKHDRHRNTVYGNTFNGSVMIDGAVKDFYDNQITETLSITDATGYMSVTDNTAKSANMTNSVDTTFDSCTIGMYNFTDNSSGNWIISNHPVNVTTDVTITNLSVSNSTYVFNGSTCMLSNEMDFTVHNGGMGGVNVSNIDGTYDLTRNGTVIATNTSVNEIISFTGNFGVGNYSILEKGIEETETEQSESDETHTQTNGRNGLVIVRPRNNTTVDTTDNTTINVIDTINTTTIDPIIHEEENEQVPIIRRIINWIWNLFRF